MRHSLVESSSSNPPTDTGKVVNLADVWVGLAAELSEDSVARAFTETRKQDLRYDHDVGHWYEWDGIRWRSDHTNKAFDYARQHGRQLSGGQRSSCRASFASGVEKFAQADRAHAVRHNIWDFDPWLLGTPNETVDLRTGQLSPAHREQYISKIASVAPEAGEPTLWLGFLDQVTQSDPELIRFLQQWVGYCLTGDTREQALLFLYGPGGNGKSVFLNIIRRLMGDYSATAQMETLVSSKYDRHPAEIAALCGARLVTASETEADRHFAEARIKELTGSDPITARFMRKDPFTFTPAFKLMIAGNHAPRLRNPDEAMMRRLRIVPFTAKPETPDKNLEHKLVGELGRILQWAIEGCLDWQQNGLTRPQVVSAATDEYFSDQDLVGAWLADRCRLDQGKSGTMEAYSMLYEDFSRFAADRDERLSSHAFGASMKRRGFESRPVRLGGKVQRIYAGIKLHDVAEGGIAT